MRECVMCSYVGVMKEKRKGILECPKCGEEYIKEWYPNITSVPQNKKITIKQLIKLCAEYDEYNGTYPEHQFEGQAVIVWILNRLKETE